MKKLLILGILLLHISINISAQEIEFDINTLISTTLENNLYIKGLKEEIKISENNILSYQSQFNTEATSYINTTKEYTPLAPANQPFYSEGRVETKYSTYGININKKLKNGNTITNTLKYERTIDNALASPTEDNNTNYTFTLNMPLMKGKGTDVNTAYLNYSIIQHKSILENFKYAVSQTIFNSIATYWNALSLDKSLKVLKDSEYRLKDVVKDTENLIRVGEMPSAELKPLQANIMSREAVRISTENDYFSAINDLGMVAGIDFEDFKNINVKKIPYPIQKCEYLDDTLEFAIETALKNRGDYKALLNQVEANKKLLDAAKNSMKKRMDLELKVGVNSLALGTDSSLYLSTWHKEKDGINTSCTLTQDLSNNREKERSEYNQMLAKYNKSRLDVKNMFNNISSQVSKALHEIKSNMENLEKKKKALDLYISSVEAEKKKLKLGMTTVIDVIKLENDYNDMLLEYISKQCEYVVNIANYAHKTGRLVFMDKNKININNNLYE